MAEPQSLSQRLGLTPGKAAVIGVLAIALGVVIYIQFGPTGHGAPIDHVARESPQEADLPPVQPAPGTTPTNAEAPDPAAPNDQTESATVLAAFDDSQWKPPELATVAGYDPFAIPAAFPQPVQIVAGSKASADASNAASAAEAARLLAEAVERLQAELTALQERGVHVIVRGRDEYVAMIGDRTVHVGDEIDGFRVTAIDIDGVHVERKLNE